MKSGFALICVIVLVAGCGGGSGGGSGASGTQAMALNAAAAAERLDTLEQTEGLTDYDNLPSSGRATYNGYGVLVNDAEENGFIGKATLTADFGDDSLSGHVEQFGYAEAADGATKLSSASGRLDITNGTITDLAGTAQIDADVSGNVTGGGKTVVVDGQATGTFVGDDYDGIGLAASPDTMTATENGVQSDYYLAVIGER
ncbi:hypothetical protein [Thioclava sp. GXIMD4215]|uniref:hypothetical protein n=1 Tax=Thioclava sp. GXIMD4215 TaxID=3131928 RepID=UPI0032495A42